MTLPVALRDEARLEFDEAFDWYDLCRPGLGLDFAVKVQRIFDRVAAHPRLYRIVLEDIRKGVTRRFPYQAPYRPHEDRIEVLAVFHAKRDPSVWHNRA